MPINPIVSNVNSTTTVLSAAGVFTGVAHECLQFGSITISVIASHASATNGLSIQQSMDGTNWDILDVFTIAAATARTVTIPRQGEYARVVYTNGGTLQTYFRLDVYLNAEMPDASSQRPGDAMSIENDFLMTSALQLTYNGTTVDMARSVVNGQNTTGTGVMSAGVLGQFDDVSTGAVSENSFAPIRINSQRAQYIEEGPFIMGRVVADGQIKGSAGFIHTITIAPSAATPVAGVLTVYNSLTETGTVVFSCALPAAVFSPFTVLLDVPCSTGIFVGFDGTLTNTQVTVSYR